MAEELNERAREVLRALVREHISTGTPVGSSQLAKSADFDVSTATLRTVMADLEALGYLEKPHTSAGRVPTDLAYRYFVDTLMKLREPGAKEREIIEQGISSEVTREESLQEASRVLHFLTRHAGLVVVPRAGAAVFHRIEFVRLRESRVLAILIGQDGEVQNKPITLDFPISSEELVHAANYLNELLRETPLEDVRGRIQVQMEQARAAYDALVGKALKLGFAATDLPTGERVLIEGTGSLLSSPQFADMERVRALFRALEEKHKLLALLDQVQRAKEMQIFIGAESAFSSAGDVSVIATPYGTPDRLLGTVGVIGPTRMNYARVIPLVNFTAQVLSRVLGESG